MEKSSRSPVGVRSDLQKIIRIIKNLSDFEDKIKIKIYFKL